MSQVMSRDFPLRLSVSRKVEQLSDKHTDVHCLSIYNTHCIHMSQIMKEMKLYVCSVRPRSSDFIKTLNLIDLFCVFPDLVSKYLGKFFCLRTSIMAVSQSNSHANIHLVNLSKTSDLRTSFIFVTYIYIYIWAGVSWQLGVLCVPVSCSCMLWNIKWFELVLSWFTRGCVAGCVTSKRRLHILVLVWFICTHLPLSIRAP